MIRVTVELVPFGNEEKKRKIGELVIANQGRVSESGDLCLYAFKGVQNVSFTERTQKVEGTCFHRRAFGVLELVYNALAEWKKSKGDQTE